MTEAEKIAAGLTEAQRELLLNLALKGNLDVDLGTLIELLAMQLVGTQTTPLGLEVRKLLEAQS